MRIDRRFLAVGFALVALLRPQLGVALELGDWVPGLRLIPFLSEQVEYESNISQTPTRAESDVIFRTSPGVLLEYGKGGDVLSLGYRTEILKFLRHSELDAVHQFFAGQLVLEFNRLQVLIRDDFVQTTDPPGTELTGRIESTSNSFTATAEYRLAERFGLGLSATWTHVEFPTIQQLTRDEYTVGGLVFWRVQPKTNLQFTYLYGRKQFEDVSFRDVDRHIILVGVSGEVTPKLSSAFRIGYEIRESQRIGSPGYQGLVMAGGWTYRPTARLSIGLLTDRSAQESIFGNQLFYVSTTATLLITQQFSPRLVASVRLIGGDNSYPGKETVGTETKFRRDWLFGWGGGIGYDVQRWLKLGVEYTHTRRDSNFPGFSYQDDKFAGTATVRF